MPRFTDQHLGMIVETHTIVKKLDNTINGNGQQGLAQRLTVVETKQNNCLAGRKFKLDWYRVAIAVLMLGIMIIELWR